MDRRRFSDEAFDNIIKPLYCLESLLNNSLTLTCKQHRDCKRNECIEKPGYENNEHNHNYHHYEREGHETQMCRTRGGGGRKSSSYSQPPVPPPLPLVNDPLMLNCDCPPPAQSQYFINRQKVRIHKEITTVHHDCNRKRIARVKCLLKCIAACFECLCKIVQKLTFKDDYCSVDCEEFETETQTIGRKCEKPEPQFPLPSNACQPTYQSSQPLARKQYDRDNMRKRNKPDVMNKKYRSNAGMQNTEGICSFYQLQIDAQNTEIYSNHNNHHSQMDNYQKQNVNKNHSSHSEKYSSKNKKQKRGFFGGGGNNNTSQKQKNKSKKI